MRWEVDPTRNRLDLDHFVSRATNKGIDTEKFRRNIGVQFAIVDLNVIALHKPPCAHHLAEALIQTRDIPGPVVECGTFKGAMAAKLSILCERFGKELYIFDSFKGLPHSENWHRPDGTPCKWHKGQFLGHRPEVENSIRYYGREDVCHIVEGYFEDTLHKHDIKPSLVFIDCDLISSMRTCLKHFWPRLQGPYFFSHEASVQEYSKALLNEEWWNTELGCDPPAHIGVGTGYMDAPALCTLRKVIN